MLANIFAAMVVVCRPPKVTKRCDLPQISTLELAIIPAAATLAGVLAAQATSLWQIRAKRQDDKRARRATVMDRALDELPELYEMIMAVVPPATLISAPWTKRIRDKLSSRAVVAT
jgi:hypothetical protein